MPILVPISSNALHVKLWGENLSKMNSQERGYTNNMLEGGDII